MQTAVDAADDDDAQQGVFFKTAACLLHSAPAPAAGEAGYPRVHEDGYFLTNYSVRMSTCEICTDSLN